MDMNIPSAILNSSASLYEQAPPRLKGSNIETSTEFYFSDQLSAFMDHARRAMWLRWNPSPRPNFNPELLQDLDRYCHFLSRSEARVECGGEVTELEYSILASRTPGVFNLGGDLNLFSQLIQSQDHEALRTYGRACINVLYRNYVSYDLPVTTISLIQGECLGGGFEAALSSDVLIAERSARFGFPEILFNLFPGMGAYSFLERKIGRRNAEELISSGKICSADEMLNLGIVDVVTDDGKGETEVSAYIDARSRTRNGLAGLAAARRCVHKLHFAELNDVLEAWVDTALRLSPRDLKLMQRLVSRQNEICHSRKLH
jgi:DSF synthase